MLTLLAVFVCSQAAEMRAQSVQLRPYAALYLPTKIAIRDGVLHVRQKIGVAVGATLSVPFNERFDLATSLTYVPGYTMFRGAGKRMALDASAHLLSTAARARYWLLSPARALSWELHTGLGLVAGGARSYAALFDTATLSAILGTTLRYEIARVVSLQLQIQSCLYRTRFGSPDVGSPGRLLQVSFGLGFPFMEPVP